MGVLIMIDDDSDLRDEKHKQYEDDDNNNIQ